MVAAVAAALTVRVIFQRLCFEVTITKRPGTIPGRIIVLRTPIMMANTVGTLPILIRAGIGKGRVVMAIMIAVKNVPRFMRREHEEFGVCLFNVLM